MMIENTETHCKMSVAERISLIHQGVTPRAVENVLARSNVTQPVAAFLLSLTLPELRHLMNDWGITAAAARKALRVNKPVEA